MLRKRLSTTGTSNWIVQKLIERDHINHHYRRLNGARSQLQLNATSPSTRRSSSHHRQLSKSNLDIRPVRFEDDLRSLERQMSSQFSLDVVLPEDKRKKKELFDQSLDVINKHSKYFSPTKEFTPRLVRKIVRPPTSSRLPCSRPITPGSLRRSKLDTSLPSPQQRPMKAVYFPDDLVQRNVSDDSAFGDGHDSCSDQSSSNISDDLEAFNFTKWLKEQEEENCYTKLMCDITGDLLQRHLCTNGHMKEIIAIYIRKSRRKFSMGANVLMKRLCDDLLIPTDESYDNRYYGSFRQAVEYYPSDQNILKDIQPATRSSNEGELSSPQNRSLRKEMEDMNPRNQRQFSMKSPEPLELMRPIDVGYQTEREDDASVHQDVLSHHLPSNKVEIDLGNIPAEVDGYCSDFTNDTDNDIEEEFDFD